MSAIVTTQLYVKLLLTMCIDIDLETKLNANINTHATLNLYTVSGTCTPILFLCVVAIMLLIFLKLTSSYCLNKCKDYK